MTAPTAEEFQPGDPGTDSGGPVRGIPQSIPAVEPIQAATSALAGAPVYITPGLAIDPERLARLEALIADVAARIAAPDSGVIAGKESFLDRVTSRKFLLTLAGVVGALASGLAGILPAEWAGGICAGLIMVYNVVNAILGSATVAATKRLGGPI